MKSTKTTSIGPESASHWRFFGRRRPKATSKPSHCTSMYVRAGGSERGWRAMESRRAIQGARPSHQNESAGDNHLSRLEPLWGSFCDDAARVGVALLLRLR